MSEQGGNTVFRDYRKGNWSVQETMVLIEAKKMDDERRMKRSSTGDVSERSKPTELRWKWVEDYCWRKGCLRSQNQCNDKWDNLMRDYKKVRDYERRLAERGEADQASYWKIEKNERKDKNLPSNMLPQIYEALVEVVEVVERRGAQRVLLAPASASASASTSISPHEMLPPLLQHHMAAPLVSLLPLPPPPPPPAAEEPQPVPCSHHPLPAASDSPAKRRRRGGRGTGSDPTTSPPDPSSEAVGSAISRSASIIAEALQASEEGEERRHRDLLSLHERRLKIEESKAEISRQGINGLVGAINKLASSIHALASHKNQSAPK